MHSAAHVRNGVARGAPGGAAAEGARLCVRGAHLPRMRGVVLLVPLLLAGCLQAGPEGPRGEGAGWSGDFRFQGMTEDAAAMAAAREAVHAEGGGVLVAGPFLLADGFDAAACARAHARLVALGAFLMPCEEVPRETPGAPDGDVPRGARWWFNGTVSTGFAGKDFADVCRAEGREECGAEASFPLPYAFSYEGRGACEAGRGRVLALPYAVGVSPCRTGAG